MPYLYFMADLNTIIEFENEHTGLDFKLEEYGKHKKIDLIKDVMAMANAAFPGDRLLIIGMKPDSQSRGIVGLSTISDAATIQQTIIDNIEPEVHLDYFSHHYDSKLLGIIRIYNCDSRPYLMKKDFNADKGAVLKRGEGFVRLGTTQARLYRSLFEQIYKERYDRQRFSGELEVSFEKDKAVTALTVAPLTVGPDDMPSSRQRKKIERIIAEKEKELKSLQAMGLPHSEDQLSTASLMAITTANITGGGVGYEHRSLKTLRKNLEKVVGTYYEHDYYFLLEEHSEKLTIFIRNLGTAYLADVKAVLRIPKAAGLLVAKSLPRNPDETGPRLNFNYRHVEETEEFYEFSKDIGDVKQQLAMNLFGEPIRLCFRPKLSGQTIDLHLFFYAKNLAVPIEKFMKLTVG